MAFIPATALPQHHRRTATQPRRVPRAELPKPLFDRVLIRRDKAPEMVRGLVLTGEAEKAKIGTVIDTGDGRYSACGVVEDMPVKKGDTVFWKDEYGAEEIPGEDDMILLRVFSIAGKV